jgi:hypothetical protein
VDVLDDIKSAIDDGRVEWRRHALERLLERGFSRSDVFSVMRDGDVIESDPDRKPFPTRLWFANMGNRPIHVVASWDADARMVHVITVYEPDLDHFESDFQTRRPK